jgi:hypothetical protein
MLVLPAISGIDKDNFTVGPISYRYAILLCAQTLICLRNQMKKTGASKRHIFSLRAKKSEIDIYKYKNITASAPLNFSPYFISRATDYQLQARNLSETSKQFQMK